MLSLDRQNQYRERYRARRPGWAPSGERYESLVRSYVQPGTRLLDLGCGRGGLIEKLGGDVALPLGIDPDRLSLAEHRSPHTLRVCAPAQSLPLPASSVDLVIATWLLEHLADPAAVLAEVQRTLRPGGHFITLTPNANHPLLLANRISQALPRLQRWLVPRLYARSQDDTFRVHYRANSPARLRALATRAGLVLVALQVIPDPTYTAFNDALFGLSVAAERLIPPGLKVHLLADFEKPA